MEIIKNNYDFYVNVERAFDEIDPKWRSYAGCVVVGSHLPTEIEKKLEIIKRCREDGTPILGICLGMQLMVVEFAQSFLGLDVTSQELNPTGIDFIVVKMPKLRVGIFQVEGRQESHWHNYKINEGYADLLNTYFKIVYSDIDFTFGKVLEKIKLKEHPYFVGVQYHPEYGSTKENPHPILKDFLEVCKKTPTNVVGVSCQPPMQRKEAT